MSLASYPTRKLYLLLSQMLCLFMLSLIMIKYIVYNCIRDIIKITPFRQLSYFYNIKIWRRMLNMYNYCFICSATCRIFVFTNSCVNVFVYSLRLQNFRKYLMKDIRLCCKKFCDYLPEKKRRSYRINRLDRGDISTDRSSSKLSGRADISIINIQWERER